ncbi:hypothetical protein SBY92_000851 [Candida maltosa Xu316]
MTQELFKVCVFCGSSFGNKPVYAEEAGKFGKALAEKNWGLVYGGGSTGLMGQVARGCATSGGYVHGVIPEALVSRERTEDEDALNEKLKKSIDNHDGSTPIPDSKQYGKTTLVKDMHTQANAFVALPGGIGSIDELAEITTWCQLNVHAKPIVVYNVDGYYDNFLKMIQGFVDEGFLSEKNGKIIKVGNTVEEVLQIIENYEVPEGRFNLKWDTT